MAVIEVENLRKEFGDVTALDGLSLSVEEGEVFGFLGPNGAGKSTTINVLLDFTRPTSGSARIFGEDARAGSVAIRERTGTLLEGYGVYEHLTGREHVEHAIATKDAGDDPGELLERVGIASVADRRAGGYSKGMRQRLALGMALVDDPDLLVLDEPSTGLDPNGARRLQNIVREEADRGATVFFSSHVLEQVEAVCDRVGILLEGRLVTRGSIDDLREELGSRGRLEITVERVPDGLRSDLDGMPGVEDVEESGEGRLSAACADGQSKLDVLNRVVDSGAGLVDFETTEASLGEVFSEYTRTGLADRREEGR